MAQARRAGEECIFMLMGKVIEHTDTSDMFVTPQHQETQITSKDVTDIYRIFRLHKSLRK